MRIRNVVPMLTVIMQAVMLVTDIMGGIFKAVAQRDFDQVMEMFIIIELVMNHALPVVGLTSGLTIIIQCAHATKH